MLLAFRLDGQLQNSSEASEGHSYDPLRFLCQVGDISLVVGTAVQAATTRGCDFFS